MKRLPDICPSKDALIALTFVTVLICARGEFAHANPYLAKPGEPVLKVRVGTCVVTGGFIHLYHLNDLGFPFVYSSLFTNSRTLKDKPLLVQRFVAGLAETVYFVEKNPQQAMAAVGKTLSIKDPEVLQSAYDAYAVRLVNRRMIIPAKLVAETIETARGEGTNIRRKPAEVFDNTFVDNLEKSGFFKELWRGEVPEERRKP